MNLRPLLNGIFFQFTEEATPSTFVNTTKSGIMIAQGKGDQSNVPRWGKVTDIGPDVFDVAVDDFVLVEAGKWTVGFERARVRQWKTDQDHVLIVADEPGSAY